MTWIRPASIPTNPRRCRIVRAVQAMFYRRAGKIRAERRMTDLPPRKVPS